MPSHGRVVLFTPDTAVNCLRNRDLCYCVIVIRINTNSGFSALYFVHAAALMNAFASHSRVVLTSFPCM